MIHPLRPPTVQCVDWEPIPGDPAPKRCRLYNENGSCQMPSRMMCEEWERRKGKGFIPAPVPDALRAEQFANLKHLPIAPPGASQASPWAHLVVYHKKAPFDVYIGRPGPWGNPYSHLEDSAAEFRVATREEAIRCYEGWLLAQPELVAKVKRELKGKVLGCWCAPLACHGHVLARIANEDVAPPQRFALPRIPPGHPHAGNINNCALSNGEDEDLCQMCDGKCPDGPAAAFLHRAPDCQVCGKLSTRITRQGVNLCDTCVPGVIHSSGRALTSTGVLGGVPSAADLLTTPADARTKTQVSEHGFLTPPEPKKMKARDVARATAEALAPVPKEYREQIAHNEQFRPAKWIDESALQSLASLGAEITLEGEPFGSVTLVAAYTGRDRKELTFQDAATIRLIVDCFPGCHVAAFVKTKAQAATVEYDGPTKPLENDVNVCTACGCRNDRSLVEAPCSKCGASKKPIVEEAWDV